jgi:hypothetical protein
MTSALETSFARELTKIALIGGKKSWSKRHLPTLHKALKAGKWGGLGLGALLAYNALKGAGEAKQELQREKELRGY